MWAAGLEGSLEEPTLESLKSGRIWEIIWVLTTFDVCTVCSVHRSHAYINISGIYDWRKEERHQNHSEGTAGLKEASAVLLAKPVIWKIKSPRARELVSLPTWQKELSTWKYPHKPVPISLHPNFTEVNGKQEYLTFPCFKVVLKVK